MLVLVIARLLLVLALPPSDAAIVRSLRGEDAEKHKFLLVLMRTGGPKSLARVESIRKTWAKDLEEGSLTLLQKDPMCTKMYGDNHWMGLTCLEAKNELALMNRTDYDWLLVVDDDVFVFPRRLRATLKGIDPTRPAAYGHPFCGKCLDGQTTGFCGGGGYVLSRQSLLRMASATTAPVSAEANQKFLEHMMSPPNNRWCDVRFGCVARQQGLELVAVKGLYGGKGIVDQLGSYSEALEGKVVQLQAEEPPLVIHNVRDEQHMQRLHREALQAREATKGDLHSYAYPYTKNGGKGSIKWSFLHPIH